MSRWIVVVVVIAGGGAGCRDGSGHAPAPGSGSPAAHPELTVKLVGCVPAHPAPDDPRPVAGRSGHRPPREWTPFATGELHAEPAVAQPIAQAVARVLGDRLPAIARCFA
ncbi:MAG: hypothetical protein M3619_10365, partial [Myxococcota bacterium]|nr:hypothetical protein [Myxococcota bacterium]